MLNCQLISTELEIFLFGKFWYGWTCRYLEHKTQPRHFSNFDFGSGGTTLLAIDSEWIQLRPKKQYWDFIKHINWGGLVVAG